MPGRSSTREPQVRREIVTRAVENLRTLPFDIDVKLCGLDGFALLELDLEFTPIEDPGHLVYATIERMALEINNYDYFLNIDDDILVPEQTLRNAMEFDRVASIAEILHPNRIEIDQKAGKYCVDLLAMPGWTTSRRRFDGRVLAVAANPHSALMFLSREKFLYALQHVDLSSRERLIAKLPESGFCNVHAPFTLWRSFADPDFHIVEHLDHWKGSPQRLQQIEMGLNSLQEVKLAKLREDKNVLQAELRTERSLRKRCAHEVNALKNRYTRELQSMRMSSSWRLTSPLRLLGQVLRRYGRGRLG